MMLRDDAELPKLRSIIIIGQRCACSLCSPGSVSGDGSVPVDAQLVPFSEIRRGGGGFRNHEDRVRAGNCRCVYEALRLRPTTSTSHATEIGY